MTILAELVANEVDSLGYETMVFKSLDNLIEGSPYVMMTRFPNWQSRVLNIGEIGYVNFTELRAGIDEWFDGDKMIKYNYNMIQFLKFIPKQEPKNYEYVMLIILKLCIL